MLVLSRRSDRSARSLKAGQLEQCLKPAEAWKLHREEPWSGARRQLLGLVSEQAVTSPWQRMILSYAKAVMKVTVLLVTKINELGVIKVAS